ncbi:MAG: hypothetical protein ACOYKE_12065 [Ferruginibacter sp.]
MQKQFSPPGVLIRFVKAIKQIIAESFSSGNEREFRRLKDFIAS